MLRGFLCAVLALFLVSHVALADKGKGKGKKSKSFGGTVTKIDAATGDLTVSTGKKNNKVEKQLKLTGATSFAVYAGQTSKKVKGNDGFKELKAGDKVRVTLGADGSVMKVAINPPKKAPNKKKKTT